MSGGEWIVTGIVVLLAFGAILMALSDSREAKRRFEADRRRMLMRVEDIFGDDDDETKGSP